MERDPSAGPPKTFGEAIHACRERLSRYFQSLGVSPREGSLRLSGDRYLLVRAASLSREFFLLVQELLGSDGESESVALDLAYDLAHAIGRSDARWFHQRFPQADLSERLFLGPAHFAHAGWGEVELDESSRLVAGPGFLLRFVHRHSFEADVWLDSGQAAPFPVCAMNAGYSSGWTSEAFGQPLSTVEIRCRAMGHEACRFVMASPSELPRILEEEASGPPPDATGRRPWKIPDPFLRQRMEQELRRSREEMERRVRERTEELSRLAARLQDEIIQREQAEQRAIDAARWEASVQVAGGISHDFNNLMGVVIGEIERLEHRFPPGTAEAEALSRAQAGCRAAASLSLQLLEFVRPGSRPDGSANAAPVIRETIGLLERVLPREVRLEARVPDHLGSVALDPDRLTRILTHLLLHARDRLPRGGRITFTASRQQEPEGPGRILLQVRHEGTSRDSGPSVPGFPQGGLSGLGIAAAQRILEACGGILSIDTKTDREGGFQVTLPAAPAGPLAQVPTHQEKPPRGSGEVLLVVEDHLALQRLLHEVLGQAGYEVLSTANPEEALLWIRDPGRRLDLLLTDVILPGMNGGDLAKQALTSRPSLKVLFMSGYPDDHLGRAGVEVEGMDLLQKPFSPSVLLREVHRLLDGS